jgi:eukaryotic-like serine/threonine-protein kinase
MDAPATVATLRRVGPYGLRQLLGKSSVGMTWLAWDERRQAELLLCMPRQACRAAQEVDVWRQAVSLADRVSHGRMAPIMDTGADGLWPYLVIERGGWQTLGERAEASGWPEPDEAVAWTIDLCEALAVLHDGGHAHRDIGSHSVLVDAQGHVCLIPPFALPAAGRPVDRDLVMAGLLLHGLLLRRPAHDVPDLPTAAQQVDLDIIRLPFSTPRPVPEALRAIVNRATERQPTRRFVGARGLLKALTGWRHADGEEGSGAVAQLMAKIQVAGVLPSLPGVSGRVARIVSGDQSVDAMVHILTEDPGLTFELLRLANAAGGHAGEEGVVLSPRRAIQLLGLNGVRRAAGALKQWPGPLSEERSHLLRRAVQRARRMAFTAAALSPRGLHEEEPLVVALLQNLGPLLLCYHFPEETLQIKTLTEGGMSNTAATCAVLGTDEESLALAVARQWGWRDDALDLVRAVDIEHLGHGHLKHQDWLRAMAAAAKDALRALDTPATESRGGIGAVVLRYARVLGASSQELQEAVETADQRLSDLAGRSRPAAPGSAVPPAARKPATASRA